MYVVLVPDRLGPSDIAPVSTRRPGVGLEGVSPGIMVAPVALIAPTVPSPASVAPESTVTGLLL